MKDSNSGESWMNPCKKISETLKRVAFCRESIPKRRNSRTYVRFYLSTVDSGTIQADGTRQLSKTSRLKWEQNLLFQSKIFCLWWLIWSIFFLHGFIPKWANMENYFSSLIILASDMWGIYSRSSDWSS